MNRKGTQNLDVERVEDGPMEGALASLNVDGQADQAPTKDSISTNLKNFTKLDEECQQALRNLSSSEDRLAYTAAVLEGERMAHASALKRISELESSFLYKLERKLEIFTRIRLVRYKIRSLRFKTHAYLRRHLRQPILAVLPVSYQPYFVARGIPNAGYIPGMSLLPFKEWPQRSVKVEDLSRGYRYGFASLIEDLSEVVLFIKVHGNSEGGLVRASIVSNSQVVREVTQFVKSSESPSPVSFAFATIRQSHGLCVEVRITLVDPSVGTELFVQEFSVLRGKKTPFVAFSELDCGVEDQGPESSCAVAPFVACFRADSDGIDEFSSIEWLPPEEYRRYVSLYGDRVVKLSLKTPRVPLTALKVVFGTSSRVNDVFILFEIVSGEFTWSGSINGLDLVDNSQFCLPIPREIFARITDRVVTIRFTSPGARADNQVAILVAQPVLAAGSDVTSNSERGLPDLPREDLASRGIVTEKRSKSYSEIGGVPIFRAALLEYLASKGLQSADRKLARVQLRISILLSEYSMPWQTREFARSLVAAAKSLGHIAQVFSSVPGTGVNAEIRHSDIFFVFDQDYTNDLRHLVTEVRCAYGIVVGCRDHLTLKSIGSVSVDAPSGLLAAASFVLNAGDNSACNESVKVGSKTVSPLPISVDASMLSAWLDSVVDIHRQQSLPKVSIVTVLYRKEREIPYFVRALAAQNYRGEIELVVVDDRSPDDSKGLLKQVYGELESEGIRLPRLTLIDNETNLGNCGSRNRAMERVTGDIVVIVDCDCLLNPSFVSAHVYSHLYHGAGVVIGPCNLESGDGDPLVALAQFDADRPRILREAQLQDPINLDSFVNCITRNFSIKRELVTEDLFDEQFGYSAHPDSGFGWEDVEMGYRLYRRGLRIYFTNEAFSVHVSHPSTTDDKVKPLKSLKNFRRLIDKHPSIKEDARRWYLDTFDKIEQWSASCGHSINPDQERIREAVGAMYPYPFAIGKNRGLRVLTYRWHVPHQYELYKLPYEFTLICDLKTGFTQKWEFEQRPKPRNATFRFSSEVKASDFDLVILHFDENVLNPENCNGVISSDWGANFIWGMQELQGVPKVAICHGTPQFIGQYQPDYHESDLGRVITESRLKMVDFLGDTPVVCNSYQAQSEWGFRNSRVIWHGFDPSEFQLTSYEKGTLSLGPAIKERPHYRGYENFKRVSNALPADLRPCHHRVSCPPLFDSADPAYARLKFSAYRDSIREYSIYFNPTLRSPMPRSRGEAMMSGLVTVSAANHDVQLFIKNGWNGFYSDSAEEMAEYIMFLSRNERACREIGGRGRRTAADVFNHDRYLAAWQSLVSELVGR